MSLCLFIPVPASDPDEMIYDDVELGEQGCGSSLDNGWSSSEFESYDEASDGEGRGENGLPDAFMRGKPPQRKTHVCKTNAPYGNMSSSFDSVAVCVWEMEGWLRSGKG